MKPAENSEVTQPANIYLFKLISLQNSEVHLEPS